MTSSRDISFQKVNRPILIVGGFILYIRIPTNVTCFAVSSLIISNIWEMSREGHDDPDIFKPERHFASDGTLLPDTIAAKPMWGFGRRGCPGRFVSEAAIWSAVVHLLAAFRITKAKDEAGKEIEVKEEFTSGVVCRPVPFQCSFVLRSTSREKAIRLDD